MTKRLSAALFLAVCLVPLFSTSACRATEPEIVGDLKFSNQVVRAMSLLKERDLAAYQTVTNYVQRIKQGQRSGMWADQEIPTYEMSDVTAHYSVTWCAATIAHDSFHSKLYHDYLKLKKPKRGIVPDNIWKGVEAEKKCMAHQIGVMEKIGASKHELNHALKQADGHYVKDPSSWKEYEKRNW